MSEWTQERIDASERKREERLAKWLAASWPERDAMEAADPFAGWEFAPGEWVSPNKRPSECTCGGCYYRLDPEQWKFCR